MKENSSPIFIPVAGGKGGVGKSLIAANLARALADLGHRVTAVDLDFGGSNLHSYLGMANTHAGVGDFLICKSGRLEDMVVETGHPRLAFLSGDGRNPFMANMTYAHKVKLMRTLRSLPDDYVVLDLGAGSSFNTLDLFLMSDRGLAVTTSHYTAIMNLMTFSKNMVMRAIGKEVGTKPALKKILDDARRQPVDQPVLEIEELIDALGTSCPETGDNIVARLSALQLRIVINMVTDDQQLDFVNKIEDSLLRRLGLTVDFCGVVPHDPAVAGIAEISSGGNAGFMSAMRKIAQSITLGVPVDMS